MQHQEPNPADDYQIHLQGELTCSATAVSAECMPIGEAFTLHVSTSAVNYHTLHFSE